MNIQNQSKLSSDTKDNVVNIISQILKQDNPRKFRYCTLLIKFYNTYKFKHYY